MERWGAMIAVVSWLAEAAAHGQPRGGRGCAGRKLACRDANAPLSTE